MEEKPHIIIHSNRKKPWLAFANHTKEHDENSDSEYLQVDNHHEIQARLFQFRDPAATTLERLYQ
jgi:hypothetical protein